VIYPLKDRKQITVLAEFVLMLEGRGEGRGVNRAATTVQCNTVLVLLGRLLTVICTLYKVYSVHFVQCSCSCRPTL